MKWSNPQWKCIFCKHLVSSGHSESERIDFSEKKWSHGATAGREVEWTSPIVAADLSAKICWHSQEFLPTDEFFCENYFEVLQVSADKCWLVRQSTPAIFE